ncbi:MAG: HD domain-containing phosphohydrolase [Anaerolineales bacterium]
MEAPNKVFPTKKQRVLLRGLLVFVLYLLGFLFLDLRARSVQVFPGIVAWYPPDGLSFAFLLTFGAPFLPVVAIASFISSAFVFHLSLPFSALIGWAILVSLAYGLAVWFLRRRVHMDTQLRKPRDLFWMITATGAVATILAMVSVSGMAASGVVPQSERLWATAQWWIGEMIGVLVVAPVMLIHVMPSLKRFAQGEEFLPKTSFPRISRLVLAQILGIFVMLYIAFNISWVNDFHPHFLVAIPLLWIAIQHGLPGASLGVFFVNFAIVRLAQWHEFNFAELGELQLMMLVITLASILIGIIVSEHKRSLKAANTATERQRNKIIFELIIISLVAVATWILEYSFDFFEAVIAWERRYKIRGLDETLVTISVLGIVWAVFSYRRWKEVEAETHAREKAQIELQSLFRELEARIQEQTFDLSKANALLQAEITERKLTEEVLEKSEKRFRALVENSLEEVSLIGADGTLIYESPTTRRPLGYPPGSFVGRNLFELLHPEDRDSAIKILEQVISEPGGHREIVLRLRHQNGSWLWMESIVHNLLAEPAVKAVVVNYRDVTERKQTEEAVRARTDELETLYELSRALAEVNEVDEVLDLVNRRTVESVHTTFARIALLEGNEFVTRSAYPIRVLDHDLFVGSRKPIRTMPYCQRVLEQDQPVILHSSNPEISKVESAALLLDLTHTLCLIPLRVRDVALRSSRSLGLLMVGEARNEDREPFTQEKMRLIRSIGDLAAIAIENTRLFRDLERSNTELSHAYEATIAGWSAALDLRDKETEGHTQRVTEMTLWLAKRMGFSEQELIQVRRGALLHDIGKMGIPDRILLKPDKLTDDEWEVMRLHPTFALQMLKPITYLRLALDIPYCHHEKWDGTGYPRKLSGENIPLAARIFAIVDVYDALTSDRPYRASWSKEKTLQHIRQLSGSHFDPRVVEAFLEMISEAPG